MKNPGWIFAILVGGSVGCQLVAGIDDRALAPVPDASGFEEGAGGSSMTVRDASTTRRDSGATTNKDASSDGQTSDARREEGGAADAAPNDSATEAGDATPDVQHADASRQDSGRDAALDGTPQDDAQQPEPEASPPEPEPEPEAGVEPDSGDGEVPDSEPSQDATSGD